MALVKSSVILHHSFKIPNKTSNGGKSSSNIGASTSISQQPAQLPPRQQQQQQQQHVVLRAAPTMSWSSSLSSLITASSGKKTRMKKFLVLIALLVTLLLLCLWLRFLYLAVAGEVGRHHFGNTNLPHFHDSSTTLALVEMPLQGQLDPQQLIEVQKQQNSQNSQTNAKEVGDRGSAGLDDSKSFCRFRRYPPHRLYGLSSPTTNSLSFLVDSGPNGGAVEYVHGKWPIVLSSAGSHPIRKLCVDQTEWLSPVVSDSTRKEVKVWPFADGTNPSVVTVSRLLGSPASMSLGRQILLHFPTAKFVVTVCMTNSQCTWNDSGHSHSHYDLPDLRQTQPDTIRNVLMLLDNNFDIIVQTTVHLVLDARFGKNKNLQYLPNQQNQQNNPQRNLVNGSKTALIALDDARLFVHSETAELPVLYVSYREGPNFGYETQVINPMHLQFHNDSSSNQQQITATIYASESTTFGGGRNMALMENVFAQTATVTTPTTSPSTNTPLLSLTWVDPVTIVPVSKISKPKATNAATITNGGTTVSTTSARRLLLMMMSTTTSSSRKSSFNNNAKNKNTKSSTNLNNRPRYLPNPVPLTHKNVPEREQIHRRHLQNAAKFVGGGKNHHHHQRTADNHQNSNRNSLLADKSQYQENQYPYSRRKLMTSNSSERNHDSISETSSGVTYNSNFVGSNSHKISIPIPEFQLNDTNITSHTLQTLSSQHQQQQTHRILLEQQPQQLRGQRQSQQRQSQMQKPRKSHAHGTNGFMVLLPSKTNKTKDQSPVSNEFLGVAHFHRPNDRNKNIFARFGHHYTHVFYTITQRLEPMPNDKTTNSNTDSNQTTMQVVGYLTGLSQEFVLPVSIQTNNTNNVRTDDGHIIQFLSGLEYDHETDHIIMAYGINDCEAAIVSLHYYNVIQPMIQKIPIQFNNESATNQQKINKLELVDFMRPLSSDFVKSLLSKTTTVLT